jgi:hypothetical protein
MHYYKNKKNNNMRDIKKFERILNQFEEYLQYSQSYRDYFGAMQYLCKSFGWDRYAFAFAGAQYQYDIMDERVSEDFNFLREVAYTLTTKLYDNIEDYFGKDALKTVKHLITKNW